MNDIDDLRAIGLTNAHAQMLMKDAKALHAYSMRTKNRPPPLTLQTQTKTRKNVSSPGQANWKVFLEVRIIAHARSFCDGLL